MILDEHFSSTAASFAAFARFFKKVNVEGLSAPLTLILATVAVRPQSHLSMIAEQVSLDLSTVSRHVATLESKGFIGRTVDPDDKRSLQLFLTIKGKETVSDLFSRVDAALDEVITKWPKEDRETFRTLLPLLAASLND